jgi:hypothetical protein
MAKRPDADREVLTSLPRSRPVRRSAKRGDRPASGAAVTTPATGTAAKRPKPSRAAAAKAPDPAAGKAPKASAGKAPKAYAGKAPKASAAKPAKAARTPKAKRPAAAKPSSAAAPSPPATEATAPPERPHVAPRRKIPPAGYAAPTSRADDPPGSAGAELISTTIQAAVELAQIGLTVGRQTLRSMLDRLPKP